MAEELKKEEQNKPLEGEKLKDAAGGSTIYENEGSYSYSAGGLYDTPGQSYNNMRAPQPTGYRNMDAPLPAGCKNMDAPVPGGYDDTSAAPPANENW